jgi:hypothetical protein
VAVAVYGDDSFRTLMVGDDSRPSGLGDSGTGPGVGCAFRFSLDTRQAYSHRVAVAGVDDQVALTSLVDGTRNGKRVND